MHDLVPLDEQNRTVNELDELTLAVKQRLADRDEAYAHMVFRTTGVVLMSVLMG